MQAQTPISGDNKSHFIKSGDTYDIISAIELADKYGVEYVQQFAQQVKGKSIVDTCQNLWNYVKSTIPYKEDKKGQQLIQLPGQLYNNRYKYLGGTGTGGDCKSMAIFCSAVLKALGNYDFLYRFISERANDDVHHVYLIVGYQDENGTPCYIPLDCTLTNFGVEVPFVKCIDKMPSHPEPKPASIGSAIGITIAEADAAYWQPMNDAFKRDFYALKSRTAQRTVAHIIDRHKSTPVKTSEFIKAFVKNWDNFVDTGSILIYYYWNDKTILSYMACQLDLNNPKDIPFPTAIKHKLDNSREFATSLMNVLGLRPEDLLQLCALSVFKFYGCTMEYMLYRCYCLELYGQPFKPRPGSPIYTPTGLISNGSSTDDRIDIVMCLPAQGGVGRPWGQPYWSRGGNILANGANELALKRFVDENPRPGTQLPGAGAGVVPGDIIGQLTPEQQQDALVAYNNWCNGNLVMLPQGNPDDEGGLKSRADIGYAFGAVEIATIIVAVVSAVATVAALVAKLVQQFKHPKEGSQIALPTTDFQWDYQTQDGCIIGHCNTANGCGGVAIAKMCNGVIVEANPNVNDPKNQPANPGNQFIGNPPLQQQTLWMGAIALAAAGGGVYLLSND